MAQTSIFFKTHSFVHLFIYSFNHSVFPLLTRLNLDGGSLAMNEQLLVICATPPTPHRWKQKTQ